jgi:hypothetical protein
MEAAPGEVSIVIYIYAKPASSWLKPALDFSSNHTIKFSYLRLIRRRSLRAWPHLSEK